VITSAFRLPITNPGPGQITSGLQATLKVACPVDTSAFLVTYLVRLPTRGLLARNKLRMARDTDMMDDSRKKDRMYLQ